MVNPLVDAITERGGECLPCDLNLWETASGLPVSRDMAEVVEAADAVVATGMTLSNGSFDVLLDRCLQQEIPFPFSQFSSRPSSLYRDRQNPAR